MTQRWSNVCASAQFCSNTAQSFTPASPPAIGRPIPHVGASSISATSAAAENAVNEPADTAALRLRLKAAETILRAHSDGDVLARKMELMLVDERQHVQVSGQEFAYGGELGRIQEVGISDAEGQARTWFTTAEPVIVRLLAEAYEDLPEPIFALTVKNMAGVEIYGTNTLYSGQPARPIQAHERREVTFAFELDLLPGHYFLSFG